MIQRHFFAEKLWFMEENKRNTSKISEMRQMRRDNRFRETRISREKKYKENIWRVLQEKNMKNGSFLSLILSDEPTHPISWDTLPRRTTTHKERNGVRMSKFCYIQLWLKGFSQLNVLGLLMDFLLALLVHLLIMSSRTFFHLVELLRKAVIKWREWIKWLFFGSRFHESHD